MASRRFTSCAWASLESACCTSNSFSAGIPLAARICLRISGNYQSANLLLQEISRMAIQTRSQDVYADLAGWVAGSSVKGLAQLLHKDLRLRVAPDRRRVCHRACTVHYLLSQAGCTQKVKRALFRLRAPRQYTL